MTEATGKTSVTPEMESMAILYMLQDFRFHVDKVDIRQSPDNSRYFTVTMDGHYESGLMDDE